MAVIKSKGRADIRHYFKTVRQSYRSKGKVTGLGSFKGTLAHSRKDVADMKAILGKSRKGFKKVATRAVSNKRSATAQKAHAARGKRKADGGGSRSDAARKAWATRKAGGG